MREMSQQEAANIRFRGQSGRVREGPNRSARSQET
jgi:hypothetical protein